MSAPSSPCDDNLRGPTCPFSSRRHPEDLTVPHPPLQLRVRRRHQRTTSLAHSVPGVEGIAVVAGLQGIRWSRTHYQSLQVDGSSRRSCTSVETGTRVPDRRGRVETRVHHPAGIPDVPNDTYGRGLPPEGRGGPCRESVPPEEGNVLGSTRARSRTTRTSRRGTTWTSSGSPSPTPPRRTHTPRGRWAGTSRIHSRSLVKVGPGPQRRRPFGKVGPGPKRNGRSHGDETEGTDKDHVVSRVEVEDLRKPLRSGEDKWSLVCPVVSGGLRDRRVPGPPRSVTCRLTGEFGTGTAASRSRVPGPPPWSEDTGEGVWITPPGVVTVGVCISE